jgi:hypothetical protein
MTLIIEIRPFHILLGFPIQLLLVFLENSIRIAMRGEEAHIVNLRPSSLLRPNKKLRMASQYVSNSYGSK